jgi:hypothetical protein
MRFMMFMLPQYQPDASAAHKADVLISLDGLHTLVKGARVTFKNGEINVTDGPFVEVKEVIGGYW